jgi:integrase
MTEGKDWLNDKCVKNWFELIGNERTIQNYSHDFPKFLNYVYENTPYKTPSDIIQSRVESLTSTDMVKRRYWEQVVVKYKNAQEQKNLRMATVHGQLRTVMSFFSKNGVKLLFSRGEVKINPSEKDKVDIEWIPSNEEVRLLYRLCDSARDRAVLLTLYQSGFSEVDVASMQIETFTFYNEKGEWTVGTTEDIYRKQRREKTNQWQQTCLSREALEEIRIMLQNRGYPKNGYLFVSFRDKPLEVRGINEMLKAVVKKAFNGKSELWKTKHLRDAFMNAVLQAKTPQEVKDAMVGHKREGARNDYAITELTIKTAYAEAFKYLTINGYGSQSRKLEELSKQMTADKETLNTKMAEMAETSSETMKNLNKRISYLEQLLTQNSIQFQDVMAKFAEISGDVNQIKKTLKNPLDQKNQRKE